MASRISNAADADQGTTELSPGMSWTTDGGSGPSSLSETASGTNAEHEEIPGVVDNIMEAETKSGSGTTISSPSRIGSIVPEAYPSDALSTEISELFKRSTGVEVNESGNSAKPTREDKSARGYGLKKSSCRGENDTIPIQEPASATPIMLGGRHIANETRQHNRPINQMESISESRSNRNEETQDKSEDENDRLITSVNDNFTHQLNSNEAIAPASSSLSAPRRRIRVSSESTGSNGGNSSSIESERSSGGSGSRPWHGRSHVERSSLPALGGNEEDYVGDENTRRRRRATGSGNSLAASLDAGMASLRRWIRTRRFGHGGGGTDAGSSSGQSSSSMTTMRLGDEDIFALSHTRSDPRRFSTTASSNSSDPTVNLYESNSRNGFLYYRPFEVRVQNDVDADSGIYGSDDESGSRSRLLHPLESTIESEAEDRRQQLRQRANSEPDRARLADFFSPLYAARAIDHRNASAGAVNPDRNHSGMPLRQSSQRSSSIRPEVTTSSVIVEELDYNDQENDPIVRQDLQHASNRRPLASVSDDATAPSSSPRDATEATHGGESFHDISRDNDSAADVANDAPDRSTQNRSDPDQEARLRWMQINRRFTSILGSVAVLFSLLLFCILISWVLLTSTYVLSYKKSCDVPLRAYFWLVSIQLMLDIFRADIMKRLCLWRPDSHNQVPARVILYNIGYLIYAMLVLRMGVRSVFTGSSCSGTAPDLFYASLVFVCLSLLAWALIILGYLIPLIFVAVLLSRNNYFPDGDISSSREATRGRRGRIGGFVGEVLPNTYSNPAPPGSVEQLRIILLSEFPDSYQRECCICMMEYKDGEVIVTTPCEHVFHKHCCQEWFQLARTCPVCRTDIPEALSDHNSLITESEDVRDSREDVTFRREENPPTSQRVIMSSSIRRGPRQFTRDTSDHLDGIVVIELPETTSNHSEESTSNQTNRRERMLRLDV